MTNTNEKNLNKQQQYVYLIHTSIIMPHILITTQQFENFGPQNLAILYGFINPSKMASRASGENELVEVWVQVAMTHVTIMMHFASNLRTCKRNYFYRRT